MNTLFKKHFWVIKLAGTALLALVTAGIVSVVIGARFFVLPSPPANADNAAGNTTEGAADGRIDTAVNALQQLRNRRIFNADWPDAAKPAKPAEPESTEPKPEDAAGGPGDKLEPSKLPITLLGTFVAASPDYSYANLQISGENKIASVGSTYLDGQATVMRIAPGHIILKEASAYTYVLVWATRDAAAAAPPNDPNYNLKGAMPGSPGKGGPPPTVSSPTPTENEAGEGAESAAAGVTKTGAYDYQVSRSMIDKELQDMAKLQREARVVPHFKDNQYQGFKLVGVRPGSLYRSLGIRSGDIITSVNGNRIDNPGKALELFEQLKKSANITVDIERRGQPRQLSYTIQ
jgi:type II secretion system protein C